MATAKQIAANRRNAQKSCGPKSPETKEKVSQNRTTHGLCGKFAVLHFESQENFDKLVEAMTEAEQPANASEVELVVKMAEHTWRARRALRLQDACFAEEPRTAAQGRAGIQNLSISQGLERHVRYHAAHDRAYRRAAQELAERRKQRQLAEIGFERQKRAAAEEQRKAEKHETAQGLANVKKQLDEIKLAKQLAAMLPPDFAQNPDVAAALAAFSPIPAQSSGSPRLRAES